MKNCETSNFDQSVDSVPFYKRSEYWQSPLAIFLIIGFIIFGIVFTLYWVVKWLLFSWMRPFSNSSFFCQSGFHKYRKREEKDPNDSYCYQIVYDCLICGNRKTEKYMDSF